MGALVLAGVIAFELAGTGGDTAFLLGLLLLVLGLIAAAIVLVMRQINQFLLHPMSQLYAWALRMCEGDFGARIPADQSGHFANLTFHINRLSEALDRLANEMDEMVDGQTQRLQRKNESLETLYEVTAALNSTESLEESLQTSALELARTLRAEQATVSIARPNEAEALLQPAEDGLNKALVFDGEHLGTLRVTMPIGAHGLAEEQRKLVDSVAQHLAMAIARAHLAEHGLNLSLMRERTMLAHELHDSLTQTLATLRMRMRMLQEGLPAPESPAVGAELRRIDEVIDEANTELRELIAHFRAPVDERELKPALESLISRCRRNRNIEYYLQVDEPDHPLPAASALQVLRIVREALTNIEKHSNANTVRVLVTTLANGHCRVLIEDDGIGMDCRIRSNGAGEHIGLSVMRDRARLLGGELSVESESGDGVQVTLDFDPSYESASQHDSLPKTKGM